MNMKYDIYEELKYAKNLELQSNMQQWTSNTIILLGII